MFMSFLLPTPAPTFSRKLLSENMHEETRPDSDAFVPKHAHHQNALEKALSNLDIEDARARYRLEAADNGIQIPGSGASTPSEKRIVFFSPNDPDNPHNWSSMKKAFIVFTGVVTVTNSTFGSSSPSNAIPYIAPYFNISTESDNPQLVLPISIFLTGYVLGPLLFGPLSETYGRKMVMWVTFAGFTIFTMATALAPTWAAFIVFRLLCGICASSPISVVGGIYADIYADPVTRGRAMAIFMVATCFGPLFAPIVSGFVSPVSWRWTFWIGLIVAGVSWMPLIFLPETYAPIILARRARRLRAAGETDAFAPLELTDQSFRNMFVVVLTRPIRMIMFELIVAASCAYLALAYAIFYMFFEAYPIVFQDIYGMSTGIAGLMFLPIGVGAFFSFFIFLSYDGYLERSKKAGKAWPNKEESRRLPLACLGGPLYVIALFWLGWSARSDVHWAVPMLAGIPFGMGFLLIFMALLNYLTDAYEIFAASAMAASSCARSVFGAVLPLAASPMYGRLGVGWASSLLAFLSLGMCVIPFAFIRYGETIRRNSKFCEELREKKAQEAADLARSRRQSQVMLDQHTEEIGEKEGV